MSFDFSRKPELTSLALVLRDLHKVAQPMGTAFFLIGAAARDLMLREAHGIDTGRQTKDVDFSVMVDGWESFSALRTGLLTAGAFVERDDQATHRLRHTATGLPLDIVPFGAIERADRKIAWPPQLHTVFDCFGLHEAFASSVPVRLPAGVSLQVAPIAALALLKITAWQDRHLAMPDRDAADLLLYLRHYMDCDTMDRAARDHGDLFEMDDYDHQATGARLLGRDMALLLDNPAVDRVLQILQPQADEQGPLLMAKQSGMAMEAARKLIHAVCIGLVDKR
jgi:predicted nucleotidyltransferase